MKALVVDDSKAMRRIIKQTLRDLGFDSDEAENGVAALSTLEANPQDYDLILVDWNMPEMNGYEFLCNIRADSKYNDLNVMMVTTESEIS